MSVPEGYWPCACVKRPKGNVMVKFHPPEALKCAKCKCTNPLAADYHCKHCGKTVQRVSGKKWIKSICGDTGKYVRLMRLEYGTKNNEKAEKPHPDLDPIES